MESSLILLYAGALGVTSLIVTILYFLYKCLMRETPYQRTFLIDEVDSKHKESDKKLIKKSKNNVRQRIIGKTLESSDKVASKEVGVAAEKSALNASPVLEVKQAQSEAAWSGSGEKVEAKKKPAVTSEKDKVQNSLSAKVGKKSVEEAVETDAYKKVGKSLAVGKDEKSKQAKSVESVDVEQQQQQQQDKKVQPKQTPKEVQSKQTPKEVVTSRPGREQGDSEPQVEKKKRNKRSNEESGSVDSKTRQEPAQNKPVVEEMLVEQKAVTTSAVQQQQQQANNNKKKAKALEESDGDDAADSMQLEFKQKKSINPTDQQLAKQQQKQLNKVTSDLQDMKRLVNDKDAIIHREQQQNKSLNEVVFQLKKELATEREVKNNLLAVNQKHNEEKQALMNSLRQNEAQSKQTISLLQQELQSAKTRPSELTIIMTGLAEENAKLKTEMNHTEKQLNEEMNQKVKARDLLNEALRKFEHSEIKNNSLELKFKQSDDRSRSIEAKQQETLDALAHVEKSYYDLQQEHLLLKKQSQPIAEELQNKLLNAKIENEELQALLNQMTKQTLDMENELIALREAQSVVSESMQQGRHDDQVMNGCNDSGVISHLESQIAEHEKDRKELAERLNAVDKKNMTLESERVELMVALEKLKKQVVDLEKELENTKLTPLPLEPIVIEQQVQVANQVANGCEDSQFIVKLEMKLLEKEEECKYLQETLENKDKKNEDLRQKNWEAMEALVDTEKRFDSIKVQHDSEVNELRSQVDDLRAKLVEMENRPVQVEVVSVQAEVAKTGACDGGEEKEPVVENVKELKMAVKFNEIHLERQEDEIKSLKLELQEQMSKNDKLREKNWEIMTTLNDAEAKIRDLSERLEKVECHPMESHDGQSSSPVKSSNDDDEGVVKKVVTVVNEVNETCQWDMSQLVLDLDTKTAELEILQSLLDQHENSIIDLQAENCELRNKTSHDGDVETKVLLEQRVEHYKKVLSDTESILRTLEASVNAEENKWRGKIEKLEKELVLLRQKTE